MPELPDAERIRRELAPLVGTRIVTVARLDASVLRNVSARKLRAVLRDRTVEAVERHGKRVALLTDGPALVIHLGMTGEVKLQPPGTPAPPFERLALTTTTAEVVYVDRRKLGGVWLFGTRDELAGHVAELGPDALAVSESEFDRLLATTSRAVKVVLMDQGRLAGLGNTLSDEILWRARLHPARRASRLGTGERQRLFVAMGRVLERSVDAGRIPRGRAWLSSQRQAAEPRCPRDGSSLRRTALQGRTSLWCPLCQPPA